MDDTVAGNYNLKTGVPRIRHTGGTTLAYFPQIAFQFQEMHRCPRRRGIVIRFDS